MDWTRHADMCRMFLFIIFYLNTHTQESDIRYGYVSNIYIYLIYIYIYTHTHGLDMTHEHVSYVFFLFYTHTHGLDMTYGYVSYG